MYTVYLVISKPKIPYGSRQPCLYSVRNWFQTNSACSFYLLLSILRPLPLSTSSVSIRCGQWPSHLHSNFKSFLPKFSPFKEHTHTESVLQTRTLVHKHKNTHTNKTLKVAIFCASRVSPAKPHPKRENSCPFPELHI
jgi:hypothetical protein